VIEKVRRKIDVKSISPSSSCNSDEWNYLFFMVINELEKIQDEFVDFCSVGGGWETIEETT